MGYDKPVVSFGQNLFNTPDSLTWAANLQNGLYSYYMGDFVLQFDGEHETGTPLSREYAQASDGVSGMAITDTVQIVRRTRTRMTAAAYGILMDCLHETETTRDPSGRLGTAACH